MPHDLDTGVVAPDEAPAERLAELNRLASELTSASGLLGKTVPPFSVRRLGAQTRNPDIITFASRARRSGLQRMSDGELAARAAEVVQTIAPVLGVAEGQPAEFAASPNVTNVADTVRIVRIAQRHLGIPIFHASSCLHFGVDDEPVTLLGRTFTIADRRTAEPRLTAAEAILAAAAFVTAPPAEPELDQFGNPVSALVVDLTGFAPRLLAKEYGAERSAVFDGGPFATPLRAGLIWFPRAIDDTRLCWEVQIEFSDGTQRYRTLVDALSAEVLYARQLVQGIGAGVAVFTLNPASPREMVTIPLPLAAYGLPVPDEPLPDFPRDWVDLDGTVGNSTVAVFGGGDRSLTGRMLDGSVEFNPDSETGEDQQVLNAFYFACRLHDLFYLLGFREKDWNFQADNGRHGGTGGDPVRVEVHPGPVNLTANMKTLVEGSSPVLKLGVHGPTGRHCALDATVVTHEFTHGVTNRLVGGPSDVHSLDDKQSRGLGEGWGDYFACTVLGTDAIGSWLVDRPDGIRGLRYNDDFPADTDNFGRLGRGRYRDEHAVGEIWAATLLEMNRLVGSTTGMQLVIHALKLSPANPSFLDMRDAILVAADVLRQAGDLTEETFEPTRDGIWEAFARFGMGPAASCDDSSFAHIVTAFSPPDSGTVTNPFGTPRKPATITLQANTSQPIPITPDTPDVESPLTVTDPRLVTAIAVTVDLDHPSAEQLRLTLRSPGGPAILHNGPVSGAQLPASFTSEINPALAALLDRPAAGAWSLLVVDLAGRSSGELRSWQLRLGLRSGAEVAEAGPNVPIPDNYPPGVESVAQLDGDGTAGRIRVQLELSHSQPADLVLDLVSPAGDRAVLRALDGPAGGPIQSFDSDSGQGPADLLGADIAGLWTLHVADCRPGDVGTLQRWRLTVWPSEG